MGGALISSNDAKRSIYQITNNYFIYSMQKIIKTVVLSAKLTNIERLNHVVRVEQTGGIQPIFLIYGKLYR